MADAALIIDPLLNATDTTTLAGLGAGSMKWIGLEFVPELNALYAAPFASTSVLMINILANMNSLQPFRQVTELRNAIDSLQTTASAQQSTITLLLSADLTAQSTISAQTAAIAALQTSNSALQSYSETQSTSIAALQTSNSTLQSFSETQSIAIAALQTSNSVLQSSSETQSIAIAALQTSDLAQQSIISAQSSLIAVLQSDATSVCSRPLCGDGTTPSNGTCIPDCDDLHRRSISCEPYCDENSPIASADAGGSSTVIVGIIVGVVLGALIALLVVGLIVRRRTTKKQGDAPRQARVQVFNNPMYDDAVAPGNEGMNEPEASHTELYDTISQVGIPPPQQYEHMNQGTLYAIPQLLGGHAYSTTKRPKKESLAFGFDKPSEI